MRKPSGPLMAVLLALLAFAPASALAQNSPEAEQLQTDLSSHEIFIETNFNGVRVIVFGAVDNSRQPTADSGLYDVAVSLRGPDENVVARQKQRLFGLWINNRSITFSDAPSYYAVLSTSALSDIASNANLRKYGLGFNSLQFSPQSSLIGVSPTDLATFRQAVIDLKKKQRLYLEAPGAISFVGRSLFRGAFDLPSNVPVGDYTADIFLFSNGRLLSTNQTQISIGKAGVGQIVYATAVDRPLLYGGLAVLIAVITGLAGSAVFRRY